MSNVTATEDERFATMFTEYAPRVRAYARRHSDAAVADEIVSETFLIAWRRRSDLPDEPLAWLLVVARNTLANQRRTAARSGRFSVEATALEILAAPVPAVDGLVVDRSVMLQALAALTAVELEAVMLVAWDGLPPKDAAIVAGCSPRAFTVRLHRARKRLARCMDLDMEFEDDRVAVELAPLPKLLKETL